MANDNLTTEVWKLQLIPRGPSLREANAMSFTKDVVTGQPSRACSCSGFQIERVSSDNLDSAYRWPPSFLCKLCKESQESGSFATVDDPPGSQGVICSGRISNFKCAFTSQGPREK
jgi:hypothetical protein